MPELHPASPHTVHIPVMGTGFTIDTPLHVARYGISSVISLVDDVLIEQMRKYHAEHAGEQYQPITDDDSDPRANRIKVYLNLLDRLIKKQVAALAAAPFEPDSEITKYFEMLPDSPLRQEYLMMCSETDPATKLRIQESLRSRVVPGTIDVNIMTKLDCAQYKDGTRLPAEFSDAKSALRGFALSTVHSSIVCSAGMNRDLYKYCSTFDGFHPGEDGSVQKKIVLKVSDYRSAEIQGMFFAKLGLWVSEFRIESGLNCGGHAFASKGYLLGPIMEEFKEKRANLTEKLFGFYKKAVTSLNRPLSPTPPEFKITVQGGIGTSDEDGFLMNYYRLDGTGWGTPFLMVPEVVNIDNAHLQKLIDAGENDVYLSDSSPLGVPFWNLRTSASEERRREHIRNGRPGSACLKGYLKLDSTLTEAPICRASREFQKKRLEVLATEQLKPEQYEHEKQAILTKSCICHDLAGGATLPLGIDPNAATAVCCGPNILNFKRIASLKEMIDHIYGRISLLTNNDRPHMFVRELSIYIDYFKNEVDRYADELPSRTRDYLIEFRKNLLDGIEYYLGIVENFFDGQKERFIQDIKALRDDLDRISLAEAV